MIKPSTQLSFPQIKKVVARLPLKDRYKLLRTLEKELSLNDMVSVIRSKAKTSSLKKSLKITDEIRQKLYDQRTKGRR